MIQAFGEYIERSTGVVANANGSTFLTTNGANYYVLGESEFRLIQRMKPSTGSDVYYVKQKGTIQFITTEGNSNQVNLNWNLETTKDISTPPKLIAKIYPVPAAFKTCTAADDDFVVIDGFNFTTIGKNSGEISTKYYKNAIQYTCL